MRRDNLCTMGVRGLDEILRGGLPENRVYLLQGEPGTGKTTLSLQFLLEGVRKDEPTLYITFSETKDEIQAVARSHGWDISKINLLELSAIEEQLKPESMNTVFHPAQVEMNQTTQILFNEVDRVRPMRVVVVLVFGKSLGGGAGGDSTSLPKTDAVFKTIFLGKKMHSLVARRSHCKPNRSSGSKYRSRGFKSSETSFHFR
jgi:hypothetical protein